MGLTYNGASIYAYNYQDGAPLGLTGPNGDNYLYSHLQVDAQGSYRLAQRIQGGRFRAEPNERGLWVLQRQRHLAGAARILQQNHRRRVALEFDRALTA